MKDEALSPVAFLLESLPIAQPTDAMRAEVEPIAIRLMNLSGEILQGRRDLLDYLRVEYDVAAPSTRLKALTKLDSDAFVAEVRKGRGKAKPLTVAALKTLREAYVETVEPARGRAIEAQALELRLGTLVERAYGLTPDEVRLMWDTAPPRMPTPRPQEAG